jgi:hypothetical protein
MASQDLEEIHDQHLGKGAQEAPAPNIDKEIHHDKINISEQPSAKGSF